VTVNGAVKVGFKKGGVGGGGTWREKAGRADPMIGATFYSRIEAQRRKGKERKGNSD